MSDNMRQSFTDKAGAALKVRSPSVFALRRRAERYLSLQPDSEKSTTEHFGDKIKGNADSAASSVQPSVRSSCPWLCIRGADFVPPEREVVHPEGWRRSLEQLQLRH